MLVHISRLWLAGSKEYHRAEGIVGGEAALSAHIMVTGKQKDERKTRKKETLPGHIPSTTPF